MGKSQNKELCMTHLIEGHAKLNNESVEPRTSLKRFIIRETFLGFFDVFKKHIVFILYFVCMTQLAG